MKEEMDEMERERSQMIAEVEAQIERALVSMAFSDNMSDTPVSENGTSRPGSALSSRASSRNPDSAHSHTHSHMRSFATGTTLAERDTELMNSHPFIGDDEMEAARLSPTATMTTVKEVDEAGDTTLMMDAATKAGQPLSDKILNSV